MYPKQITIEEQTYAVTVDRNSSGEIQYFNLIDPNGDIFYETDWEGDFTAEDVLRNIQESSQRNQQSDESNISTGTESNIHTYAYCAKLN